MNNMELLHLWARYNKSRFAMITLWKYLCTILVGLTLVSTAMADPFTCKTQISSDEFSDIIEGVEEEYADISTLSAHFFQKSYFLGLDRTESSQGEIIFKKPGKMRWNYKQPEEQLFVADGTSVSFYQPSMNQVTIGDFQSSFRSDMPTSFLLGLGTLRDKFTVVAICKTDDGYKISLVPKQSDASLENFQLLVRTETYLPIGAQMADVGGNETTITFAKIDLTKQFPDSAFAFQVPRGVDVIDNRGAKPVEVRKTEVKEDNLFEPVAREQPKPEPTKTPTPIPVQGTKKDKK